MHIPRIFLLFGCYFVVLATVCADDNDEGPYSDYFPLYLIGFPIIALSVRITNFLKKLAYALNPDTYVNRVKRAQALIYNEEILDVDQIEKKLVAEFGNGVCIYEKTCIKYAKQTLARRNRERVFDFAEVFREYRSSSNSMKENYLLSVFLGDIIGSPKLCYLLAEKGRVCNNAIFVD